MFRASVILKNAREDHSYELEEISKKLKISLKYLKAIENEDRANFPQEPYCSLIIKDYAAFLGLNGEEILSLFRRDFANAAKSKTQADAKLFFTPQFTFKVSLVVSLILFTTYLTLEYVKFNRPPMLKVNWPNSNIVNADSFDLTGVTDPESTIRIKVAGDKPVDEPVIVDQTGGFEGKISLTTNESKVIVESKSPSGKVTQSQKVLKSNL